MSTEEKGWALGFLVALSSAIILRRSAEKLRRNVLRRIRVRYARVISTTATDEMTRAKHEARARSILQTQETIESERRGAFGSYLHNPVVRALLIPFSGVGTLALLDLFL